MRHKDKGSPGQVAFPAARAWPSESFQGLAADGSVATFELPDAYPCDAAEASTFDFDYRAGDFGDEVLLL